jgi:uncharacterized protein (DUF433 family)
MQLEEFFNFLSPDDIRLKGSRIGIESVLYEYVHRGKTPEEIAERFDTLTLDQVYATILYYLQNKEAVEKYLSDWIEFGRTARAEQPPPTADFLERVRQYKAARSDREQVRP